MGAMPLLLRCPRIPTPADVVGDRRTRIVDGWRAGATRIRVVV